MQEIHRERFDVRETPPRPNVPSEGVIETDRSPPVADSLDRYLAALESGDLQAAARQAVAIETDPPPVGDLLTAFTDAVVRNRVPQVRTLRQRLRERYAARRPPERARRTRVNLWATAADGDLEGIRAVGTFGEQASEAARLRRQLLAAAVPIRAVPMEQKKRERLRNLSARLAERERLLAAAAEEATAVVADADLPPSVAILDVAPDDTAPGEPATVSVVVANVGDAPASGISLSATADGASVDSPSELGSIDPATRVELELSVTPQSTGHHPVDVELRSGNAGTVTGEIAGTATESAVVWADDAVTSIPAAYDRDGDGLLNTDEIQRAVADFQREEPIPGTDDQTLDAETLRQLLVLWALDQPV